MSSERQKRDLGMKQQNSPCVILAYISHRNRINETSSRPDLIVICSTLARVFYFSTLKYSSSGRDTDLLLGI